jgi:gas vesicle protein
LNLEKGVNIMDDRNGQTFLSFLIGFIMGGLIGAAVALLYAPQSGEETRAAIRDKSIELKDQASEQAAQLRDQAQVRIADLQSQAQQQLTTLQEQVTVMQDRLRKQTPTESAPPEA